MNVAARNIFPFTRIAEFEIPQNLRKDWDLYNDQTCKAQGSQVSSHFMFSYFLFPDTQETESSGLD